MKEQVGYLPKEIIDVIEKCRSNALLEDGYLENFERNSMIELPLHIGVIGKMKAGKSTFLNALIFKDNVLGMSVVPMTAVLTEISYNEQPETEIEVELFCTEDIDNIKEAINNPAESESKRAKEHFDAICAVENYESRLGAKYNIPIEELNEYTSTEGSMSALVKCVRIKYHNDVLKGITIIDTPGFNDPVQSRVEATKIAISKCQVLLFLHSTTNHYDKSEVKMLKEQVELAKTAKLIDIVNRIDELPLEEWIESKNNIKRSKENLIGSGQLDGHALSLLKNSRTDYASAIMALLGFRIGENSTLTYEEEKLVCSLCQEFDICKEDFIEYSNIAKIINLVNEISGIKDTLLRSSLPNELRGELIKAREILEEENIGLQEEIGILSSEVQHIQQSLGGINALLNNINNVLSGRELQLRLEECIYNKKSRFSEERDSRAANEFTETNYGNYNALSNGVKLANMSRYNDFVYNYICNLRIELRHFIQSFRSEIDTYLNSIENHLIDANVERKIINMFMPKVKKLIPSLFANVSDSINHYGLNSKLKGNPQKDIYRNDFSLYFDDAYLNNVFERLKPVVNQFDFVQRSNFKQNVFDLTMELKRELTQTIQNPTSKQEKINGLYESISENERKISEINDCVESLEQLMEL